MSDLSPECAPKRTSAGHSELWVHAQIARPGKSLLIFRNRVKPRNQKYFPSPPTQIRCISKPSRPDRGALRTSRNAGRDAVDAAASGVREEAQATVSNKPGHREEHEVSRKTIARGMPGVSGVTVVTTLVCFFHLHARLRAHWTPGIPCAL